MVLTLELPIRRLTINPTIALTVNSAVTPAADPRYDYESRFGALPGWLDELSTTEARALVRSALRRGRPLAAADLFG